MPAKTGEIQVPNILPNIKYAFNILLITILLYYLYFIKIFIL